MTETVRVPEPVYQRATSEAKRKDVSRGAVIRDWMDKAERFDQLDNRSY